MCVGLVSSTIQPDTNSLWLEPTCGCVPEGQTAVTTALKAKPSPIVPATTTANQRQGRSQSTSATAMPM